MEWTNPHSRRHLGRRGLPDRPPPLAGQARRALVAALLMASSAQFLAMAMTPFAMSAHLAFNLLWLWCFLRRDWKGDAGALAAGFVATGLHQLLFHPLFVLPFVGRIMVVGAAAALPALRALLMRAIGLFWVCYWQICSPDRSGAGATGGSQRPVLPHFAPARPARRDRALGNRLHGLQSPARASPGRISCCCRFALLAWPAVRRGEGIARPLAAGILLTLVAMLLLLPWQGLGWGYRYLHGLLGSMALLAGYGWNSVAGEGARRDFVLAAGTVFSLLVLLPMHLKHAHDYRRALAPGLCDDPALSGRNRPGRLARGHGQRTCPKRARFVQPAEGHGPAGV